jgi:hypothetical protein
VTVGGTNLRPATSTTSRFSKVVHVRRAGLYRVLAESASGAFVSAYSGPLAVR